MLILSMCQCFYDNSGRSTSKDGGGPAISLVLLPCLKQQLLVWQCLTGGNFVYDNGTFCFSESECRNSLHLFAWLLVDSDIFVFATFGSIYLKWEKILMQKKFAGFFNCCP